MGLQTKFELWLPLTFRPPMLMWPLYPHQATNLNNELEDQRYEKCRDFRGFYYKFKNPFQSHVAATDFRETTRKVNAGGPVLD